MTAPGPRAEQARFYREQAEIAERNGACCANADTADAFRKVAAEWRRMAAKMEREPSEA